MKSEVYKQERMSAVETYPMITYNVSQLKHQYLMKDYFICNSINKMVSKLLQISQLDQWHIDI